MSSSKLLARFALGVCILLAAAAGWAQSEGMRVDSVQVQGLVGYRPAQILPRLKVQQGKPYRAVDVQADLTELGRIMNTASVRTEPSDKGGVNVIYTVTEFPRFRKLQVIGNQKVTTSRIEGLAKLKPGDVLDQRTQESLLRALRTAYREAGMPQARIGLNLVEVPAAAGEERKVPQADLQIVVDEGRQVLVKDVIIQGNKSFSGVRLRFLLDTKGSWGFVKNYYDESTFRDDLAKLRDFYAAHGYFDAKIERGAFQEQPGAKIPSISPVIQVTEGQRYTFGKATVRGARLFSQADVTAPFKELEGKLFDGKKFAAALDELRALYQDHGLLTTEIDPKYEYDVKNKVLNVSIDVSEKDRIYVGKIKLVRPAYDVEDEKSWFRGWYDRFSPPVKEQTVMREILLKPGEVYSKRLERESLRRLAGLEVFDNDKLKAYNEPTGEPGVHNMVVEAEETVTGAISGGVGFGDVTGPFVFGSFTERNIAGEANAFTLQALLGTRDSSLVASYLDRHLGASDDSLLTRLYLQNQLAPGYRARIIGGTSEWGRPLNFANSNWTMYVRPRLEWVSLSERSGYDARENLDRAYAVATGRIRFTEDTRYPFGGRYHEGYLQAYSLEAGYAGGALIRLEAMRDQYIPLTRSLTWRTMAFGGIMPYGRDALPIHERYFLGGDTDMRGFRYRGAGYFDPDEKRVPIGGAAKLLVKNELQFPIYDPVSGVAFVDVGSLARDPVSWQVPRVSTGLGLRFDMRRVQVALDFAVPVMRQSHDQTRFFHFSLQSQF